MTSSVNAIQHAGCQSVPALPNAQCGNAYGINRFEPPFCPASGCAYHRKAPEHRWYIRWGFTETLLYGRLQRYRCRRCGCTFSAHTFSVNYHIKRWVDLAGFCRLVQEGMSVRALGRLLGVSTGTVANRVDRLMRQSLAIHGQLLRRALGREALVADGFRSFCVSQYFPCDLTLLVGSDSEMVYAFDYAPLRRGGRMKEAQKRRRARLEQQLRADPKATALSFGRLLDTVVRVAVAHLPAAQTLWTDRHPSYRSALARHPHIQHLLARGLLSHRTVSSRAPRTAANPLRAVNYMDRELRKDRPDHRRETVCHARNVCAMLGRLAVYVQMHNLMKCKRIVGSRAAGAAEAVSRSHGAGGGWPALQLAESMVEMVTERKFLSREEMTEFAEMLWRKEIPTPLKRRPERVPNYALA